MVEYSESPQKYHNLSYEETCKVVKEYFKERKSSKINFEIFPLKNIDSDMDLPITNNCLEDKFLGP